MKALKTFENGSFSTSSRSSTRSTKASLAPSAAIILAQTAPKFPAAPVITASGTNDKNAWGTPKLFKAVRFLFELHFLIQLLCFFFFLPGLLRGLHVAFSHQMSAHKHLSGRTAKMYQQDFSTSKGFLKVDALHCSAALCCPGSTLSWKRFPRGG